MFLGGSRWMPCEECGMSVQVGQEASHVCDPERRADYQIFRLRGSTGLWHQFETGYSEWLASSEGRFQKWLAQREIERSRGEKGKDEEK